MQPNLSYSDFDADGIARINLEFHAAQTGREQGLVYGTVSIAKGSDGKMILLGDIYDFNFRNQEGSGTRDLATFAGISYSALSTQTSAFGVHQKVWGNQNLILDISIQNPSIKLINILEDCTKTICPTLFDALQSRYLH